MILGQKPNDTECICSDLQHGDYSPAYEWYVLYSSFFFKKEKKIQKNSLKLALENKQKFEILQFSLAINLHLCLFATNFFGINKFRF